MCAIFELLFAHIGVRDKKSVSVLLFWLEERGCTTVVSNTCIYSSIKMVLWYSEIGSGTTVAPLQSLIISSN